MSPQSIASHHFSTQITPDWNGSVTVLTGHRLCSHRFCSFTKHWPLFLLLSPILLWKIKHNTTGSAVIKGSWLVTILYLEFSQQLLFFLLNGTNVQMCKWLFQFHQWRLLQVHLSVFLLSHVLIQFFFWIEFLLLRLTGKCKSWLSLLGVADWTQVKVTATTIPMLLKINFIGVTIIAIGFSLYVL